MKEIFKQVNGFENLYEVSNFGRVKSLDKIVDKWDGKRLVKSKILKPQLQNNGYLSTTLYKELKPKTLSIHRLVAEAFIPNPENKKTVNHIDGNKLNNHLENLEWNTHKENHIHSKVNKLKATGSRVGTSLLTEEQVLEIRTYNTSIRGVTNELAKKYGVSRGCIQDIIYRKSWFHI